MEQFLSGLALGMLVSWLTGLPKFIWDKTAAATELHALMQLSLPLIGTVMWVLCVFLSRDALAGSLDWLGIAGWALIYAPVAMGGMLMLVKHLKSVQDAAAEEPAEQESLPARAADDVQEKEGGGV